MIRPILLCLLMAAPAQADVTVFAAASLKTALDNVVADWPDPVRVSYGGSSQLARQIVAGAPADVFIAASPDWMDAVEDAGVLVRGSRRDLLGNALVLVAPADDAAPLALTAGALEARLGDGRLAMALVDAVPAGQYGAAALRHLGLWDGVVDRVAQADNVRAALAFVALNAAPLGLVYATDAAAERRVTIVATIPADSHPPIVYPAAALSDTTEARAFLDHLTGHPAFAAQGFVLLPPP